MRLSKIAVDVKAQEEGEWREHPNFDGVRVKVSSIHSEAYRKRRAQLMNRLPRRQRKLGDAVLMQEEIDRESLSACLHGWENIENEAGDPIEFDESLARDWSKDPKYRDFFDGIEDLAREIGRADERAIEESVGN